MTNINIKASSIHWTYNCQEDSCKQDEKPQHKVSLKIYKN